MAMREDVHLEATKERIAIHDSQGEIIAWTREEWEKRPAVIIAAVEAASLAFGVGPGALRKRVEMYKRA